MLPALEVLEKPYESSRAPKQTVDGIYNLPSKHLQAKKPKVELTLQTNLPNDK